MTIAGSHGKTGSFLIVGAPGAGPRHTGRTYVYKALTAQPAFVIESDETGAPLAVFSRSAGSVDAYAAAVGRWLVTRDGFDFLVHYLPDYDFASHAAGPGVAESAIVLDPGLGFAKAVNLTGGLDLWAQSVDPSMKRY